MDTLYIVKLFLNGKRVLDFDKVFKSTDKESVLAYSDYLLTHFGGDDVVRVEISKF